VLVYSPVFLGQQVADGASLEHVRSTGITCPLGVEASLSGEPTSMEAEASINGKPVGRQDSKPEGQVLRLHLEVSNPSDRDIVGAKFTVHGFSRKLRSFDLSNTSNKPDLWKTVDVELDLQGKSHASKDISLTRFTAVMTSIDLDSIVYAEGISWRAPSPAACSFVPNSAMRIASAQ
jgi:hypothetical protein